MEEKEILNKFREGLGIQAPDQEDKSLDQEQKDDLKRFRTGLGVREPDQEDEGK